MSKILLYCTKAKPYLYRDKDYCFDTMNTIDLGYKTFEYTNQRVYDDETGKFLGWENYGDMYKDYALNGKIVAECDFEVEEIETYYNNQIYEGCRIHTIKTYNISKLLELSCLNQKQLDDYLGENNGYAIHIKNLHIFDKPRELYGVYKIEDVGGMLFAKPLINTSKNMMRVSVNHWEYATYSPNDINILISIKPEDLCRILNGKQTIVVRKKVLKEML